MNGESINLQEVGMLSVDACGVELRDSTFRWIVGSKILYTVRRDIRTSSKDGYGI